MKSLMSDRYLIPYPQASFGSVQSHVSPLSTAIFFETLQIRHSMGSLKMDWATGFMPYGDRWRSTRRGLHANLHPGASKAYRPHEQHAVHHLLRNLLQSPESFPQHLRQ